MQDNENVLRDTSVSSLSVMISQNTGQTWQNVRLSIYKMINNQMVTRCGGKRRASFRINYFQKDIPGYILERAPQDIQDKVKAVKEGLKPNQYMDEVGCIVTKPEKKEEPEPEPEPEKIENKEEKTDGIMEEAPMPVEIKTAKDGQNFTITLNFTFNK